MRDIKFRAWSQQLNQMLNNNWVYENFSKMSKNSINKLMQYTGIKDKNGNEIYEDDILEDDEGFKFIVIWKINRWVVSFGEEYEDLGKLNDFYEVVGNIYENPETIENRT